VRHNCRKSILDNAKDVAKAVHEINNLELYQRVLNLHSDIGDLVEENIRLRDENKEMKESLRLKDELKFQAPFYFREGDDTPYCGVCWESKTQAVHVVHSYDNKDGSTDWLCPSCKHQYTHVGIRRNRTAQSLRSTGGSGSWMG
jgi:regulator of replication initiation timing